MTEEEQEKIAHRIIEEAGRLDLKQTLDEFDEDTPYRNNKGVVSLWVKQSLKVAAIFLVAFGIYHFGFNSTTPSELYESYYTIYDAPSAIRGEEDNQQPNWNKALEYYKAKNFNDANVYFERAKGEIPEYQLNFFSASTFLAMDNVEKALKGFNEVLETDNDYNQQAKWYKALCLIKLEDIETAKKILNTIIAEEGYKSDEAKQILSALD
ncbi:tetratricopeptide repeat protein [Winogradskyella sp. 3972H.M.0a.05]|uniref:tetratricopeptide repeat protein n=1 Tax=Winogradskyella sp. 3972H.M.0a.05 TaxID=2950277 RepID=UPI003391F90F